MSDLPDSDVAIHWFHTIWSGILTFVGGLVVWNWNRLNKQIDEKASKSEVQQLRDELKERWRAQDQMHSENRRRLDQIIIGVSRLRGRRRDA